MQQLRNSGLFDEGKPQENGSVHFQVKGKYGATIYVTKQRERALLFANGISWVPSPHKAPNINQNRTVVLKTPNLGGEAN